jgi:hypothetical protein
LTPAADDRANDARAAEIASLAAECARLAEAIARGGRLAVLLKTLEDRQSRLSALERARVPEPGPTADLRS